MYKLTIDEIETRRTPQELSRWMYEVIDKINNSSDKEYRKKAITKGTIELKVFFEETITLVRFCENYFNETTQGVQIIQKVGNQNFDATIDGCDEFNYIEITNAINGKSDALRRVELSIKGSVDVSGPIAKKGNKSHGNLKILFGEDIEENMQIVEEKNYFDLIEKVFHSKIAKKYNQKTLLIISFDDTIDSLFYEDMKIFGDDYKKVLDDLFDKLFKKLPHVISGLCFIGKAQHSYFNCRIKT